MTLMSCKLDNPTNYAVVIDFGVGAIWNIEGETVIFQTDSKKVELPMNSDGEFLVMGGGPAITDVLPVVSTTKASFTVNGIVATFDLAAAQNLVIRFKALCHPSAI
ncbi:hypothetical protein [uncultured Agrobacterium sp.]|uniref:hypothetical protein n=1 Tax=uncultured Agrobacterium sp. TaxID=157277 RepID=UPI0025DAD20A|nr:hypothetical protein [uncultured Agrobacterium sp.]